MSDGKLKVIIDRPVICPEGTFPYEELDLMESTMIAIKELVRLDMKVQHQKSEIKGIHYQARRTEEIAKEEHEKGFQEGMVEGKRIAKEQQRAVNIAISMAYKEGFDEGVRVAEENHVVKEGTE